MGPKYVGAFVVALGLNLACSRVPKPAPTEKSLPEISRLLTPKYSTAGIAPSGATATAPLAPGRLVSIYGANLGPTQPCHASPDPNRHETPNPRRPNQTLIERQVFPGRLCDTEVQVGGVAAGLLYVSAGQINFKVPQSTATQGETTLRVLYKGQPGPSVSLPLAENAPAGTAEDIAASMWSGLQRVKWLREYTVGSDTNRCDTVPAHPSLRDGLYDTPTTVRNPMTRS